MAGLRVILAMITMVGSDGSYMQARHGLASRAGALDLEMDEAVKNTNRRPDPSRQYLIVGISRKQNQAEIVEYRSRWNSRQAAYSLKAYSECLQSLANPNQRPALSYRTDTNRRATTSFLGYARAIMPYASCDGSLV